MSVRENLRTSYWWAFRFALGFAAIATAFAVIAFIAHPGRSFGTLVTTLGIVLGGYAAAAVVSGLVVGLLLRIGRTLLGALALGFFGGVSVYGVVGAIITPKADWWPGLAVVAMACGLVVGVPLGWLWWRDEYGHR